MSAGACRRALRSIRPFSAVPMGKAVPTAASFEMMATASDEQYVVRGLMDSDRIVAMSDSADDEPRVFVDAQIGAMPICPGDRALGNAADVRGLLNVGALGRLGLGGDGVAVAIVDTGINLAHLRSRGLSVRLDPHIHWTPTPGIKPGEYPGRSRDHVRLLRLYRRSPRDTSGFPGVA